MQVKKIYDFDIRTDCWGGAKERIDSLTSDLVDDLANLLEDGELWQSDDDTDGIPDETTVNDFIWFDDDTYADWLGFYDSNQMFRWCELVNSGVDEDEIYTDGDELKTEADLVAEFDVYMSENPDWEEDYSDWEEWAADNGWEIFDRG